MTFRPYLAVILAWLSGTIAKPIAVPISDFAMLPRYRQEITLNETALVPKAPPVFAAHNNPHQQGIPSPNTRSPPSTRGPKQQEYYTSDDHIKETPSFSIRPGYIQELVGYEKYEELAVFNARFAEFSSHTYNRGILLILGDENGKEIDIENIKDGCDQHYNVPKDILPYGYIVVTRWRKDSDCSPAVVGINAWWNNAFGVINIEEDCVSEPCDPDASLKFTSKDTRNLIQIPFLSISSHAGLELMKDVQRFSTHNRPWARILLDKPEPPLAGLPQHMMTLAMAAPLVIFTILCVSKMIRRGRYVRMVPIGETSDERRAREAAKKEILKEFAATLTSFKFSEFSEREDYEMLKDSDMCTICIDGFEDDDIVRKLPCSCFYIYHAECIDPWILEVGTCPTCKHQFIPDLDERVARYLLNPPLRANDNDYDDDDDDVPLLSNDPYEEEEHVDQPVASFMIVNSTEDDEEMIELPAEHVEQN